MIFKTRMIRVKGDRVSQRYADYCKKSWDGFDLRMVDAVTPATLHEQSGVTFGRRSNGRELTDTEKACFYSQYNLWKKCAVENAPILILEHDAWLENPSAIQYNPNLEVQFLGQHSMEAVLYHPRFARRLMRYCETRPVSGPMQLVDTLVGYFNKGQQSRYARPHARYMGPLAPVKSVIDPAIGTTVNHDGTTADRLIKDRDLFKIVDTSNDSIR
jgi:hypothetical protein